MRNKRFAGKDFTYAILLIICVIAVLSALYTCLTYGQVCMDSDTAINYRYYKGMKLTGSIYPKTWNAANGEICSFDRLPVNVLMLALIKNPIIATALTSAISFLLVCLSMIWLSEKFFDNKSWVVAIPILAVYMSGKVSRDMFLFQSGYCFTLIAIIFAAGLFLKISTSDDKANIKDIIAHCLMLFLMMVGGIRYAIEFILPLAATVFVYCVYRAIHKEKTAKIVKKSGALLIVPAALGYILYRVICSTHNMNFGTNSNPTIRLDFEYIASNFSKTINNVLSLFGYSIYNRTIVNIAIVVVAGLICVVIPVMQLIQYKDMTQNELNFFVFGFMHNAELLLAIIVGGLTEERYLLSSIGILVVVSANYIYKVIGNIKFKAIKYALIALHLLFTLFLCRDLLKLTKDWQDKFEAKQEISQQLIDNGITKAYATYWMGYTNELYSKGKLTVGGVDISQGSFKKQYSNCDDSAYYKKNGKSCLFLSEEEVAQLISSLGDNFADRTVGEPVDVLTFEGPYLQELYGTEKIYAYVYDEDICDKLTDGLRDGKLIPTEMDYNMVGSRTDESIYLTQGGMVHGPYARISPGSYLVNIEGKDIKNCKTDVVSFNNPDAIEFEVTSQTEDEITIDLEISNYVDDIQFYLINEEDITVEFHDIIIDEK